MLYVVEIRRDREYLANTMSVLREWLDAQRLEPDAFRCRADDVTLTFRVEFKSEGQAFACADAFGGQVSTIGDASTARRHP